ncbi:MAG: glutamyl-tRNA reductase [Planctomycetota bacterium]
MAIISARLGLEETLRVVGLSHHTAPVALRERLAFRPADQPKALQLLRSRGFREAVVISTCNRVEVYAVAEENCANAGAQIRAFLAEYHCLPESQFVDRLYEQQGSAAAQHLFEVTASLDSQILGESEILGQVKDAYRVASESGACGPALRALLERAFFLAKQARSEGGIGRSPSSVSSAAVALARKVFELKNRKILMIGTGEMAAGIVRALRVAGVTEILVVSRTEDRAREFARCEGGTPCKIQDLIQHLASVDVALVSAASPKYIIGPAHIRAASERRSGRNLCLIDISVPRNVDPAVHALDGVFLYDIDNLEEVARDGRREREAVAAKWRPRLAEEARKLLCSLREHGNGAAPRQLIAYMEGLRQEALAQVKSAELDSRALNELHRALERMQGQLLHGPLETLKQAAREGDGVEATAWITRLFKLDESVTRE